MGEGAEKAHQDRGPAQTGPLRAMRQLLMVSASCSVACMLNGRTQIRCNHYCKQTHTRSGKQQGRSPAGHQTGRAVWTVLLHPTHPPTQITAALLHISKLSRLSLPLRCSVPGLSSTGHMGDQPAPSLHSRFIPEPTTLPSLPLPYTFLPLIPLSVYAHY